MLKDGEKGVVLQRDKKTYAIAPHIPCGVVTPDLLRKIADIGEKYNAKALKITGATRIAMIGIEEDDVTRVWEELGIKPAALLGLCVRSVRACPGTRFCRLGQQDALGMGSKLDGIYHGMELPSKFKIAVSGCNLNCAESWVRDIGLFGRPKGWTVVVGGNVGAKPRIAKELIRDIDGARALDVVAKVIEFYQQNAKRGERMGKMIERMGIESLKEFIL